MSWYQEHREAEKWDRIHQEIGARVRRVMEGRMCPERAIVVKRMREDYSKYGKNNNRGLHVLRTDEDSESG